MAWPWPHLYPNDIPIIRHIQADLSLDLWIAMVAWSSMEPNRRPVRIFIRWNCPAWDWPHSFVSADTLRIDELHRPNSNGGLEVSLQAARNKYQAALKNKEFILGEEPLMMLSSHERHSLIRFITDLSGVVLRPKLDHRWMMGLEIGHTPSPFRSTPGRQHPQIPKSHRRFPGFGHIVLSAHPEK